MTSAQANPETLSVLDRPNSYIGKTVPRPNLDRLMQGRGLYVSDIELPRMAHVVFLRSPHAHAKINGIDASVAKQMPGVIAVVSGKELSTVITPWVGVLSHLKGLKSAPQSAIAIDRVCWQGEAVAAVVASSRAQAEDAAEHVAVDYEELEAVTDMRTALDPATAVIHASLGDNLAFERNHDAGAVDQAFAESDEVVEAEFIFGRHTGVTLEPRSVVADWNAAEARLTIYQGTQAPHMVQNIAALHLGLRESQVRVVCKDVGGSFGIKVHIYADEMATYALSKLLRRPVKFVADRVESFNTDIHARDHRCKGKIGVKRDGTITAFEIDDLTGIGPYSMYPRTSAIEANQVVNLVGGPYVTRNYRARARVVFQNKNVMCQYRAVGHPIACSVTEGLVDLAAMKIGMDPVEIRRRNLIADDAYPCASPSGLRFEQLSHHAALAKLDQDDGLRRVARRAGGPASEEHPSRHRHRQLHRGHQSQCGVLWRRRCENILAGWRRGAARRAGVGDLPNQYHRAGTGIGIAHRADRRKRAWRLDGSRPRDPGRYRQYALWRRHLGLARRRHRWRGRASSRQGAAQEHPRRSGRRPAIDARGTRHCQQWRRECRRWCAADRFERARAHCLFPPRYAAAGHSARVYGYQALCPARIPLRLHQWRSGLLAGGRYRYRLCEAAEALGGRGLRHHHQSATGR